LKYTQQVGNVMGMKIMDCPKCSKECDYNEMYDSYYCKHCNLWNEDECSDPHCLYCKKRPKRPLKIKI